MAAPSVGNFYTLKPDAAYAATQKLVPIDQDTMRRQRGKITAQNWGSGDPSPTGCLNQGGNTTTFMWAGNGSQTRPRFDTSELHVEFAVGMPDPANAGNTIAIPENLLKSCAPTPFMFSRMINTITLYIGNNAVYSQQSGHYYFDYML